MSFPVTPNDSRRRLIEIWVLGRLEGCHVGEHVPSQYFLICTISSRRTQNGERLATGLKARMSKQIMVSPRARRWRLKTTLVYTESFSCFHLAHYSIDNNHERTWKNMLNFRVRIEGSEHPGFQFEIRSDMTSPNHHRSYHYGIPRRLVILWAF